MAQAGGYWDLSDPIRPTGLFDPDAKLDIPFDWNAWLTDLGATYVSHTIEADPALEVVGSAHSAGIVLVVVKLADPAVYVLEQRYQLTCHLVATVGASERKDDRSVYLKIIER